MDVKLIPLVRGEGCYETSACKWYNLNITSMHKTDNSQQQHLVT